jgi:acyl-CoA synthetase (NDP forming)
VHYECDGQTSTATIDLVHGQLPKATARRHWHAAARSLDPFVRPGTILVVGSPSRSVPAFRDVLSHLRAANPRPAVSTARVRHDPARGPWLSAPRPIPDSVDLAILAVRPNELRDAVDSCVRAGARAILAMAPGGGQAWSSLDAELAAVCASAGVRLLGPGSGGVVNTDPDVRLDASTWPLSIRAGEVCLVAGSRRQAVTIAGLLDVMDVGLSTVFMLGDAVDVTAADVLAFAAEDPRTRVAVVSLDGTALDQLRSLWAATDLAVVAFVPPGGKPPLDHGSPPPAVIVARTWMELADAVVLLLCQTRPAGPRAAVLTTTTAAGRAADRVLEDAGLLTATVTQHTEMRTRMLLPAAAHTGGSVTAPAGTDPTTFGLVLRTLADDPGVDAIICAVDPVRSRSASLAETLDSVSRDYPDVTLVSAVPLTRPGGRPRLGLVPCMPDLHRAARALANVCQPRPPLPVSADPSNS